MQISSEFIGQDGENQDIWNSNAEWWDNKIGQGNEFQDLLIEPNTEKLLEIQNGDEILDIACGAGRFARRMEELGAIITAFDQSEKFINLAKQHSKENCKINYLVLDSSNTTKMLGFGNRKFDKAVCTMALMDMPKIEPLAIALRSILKLNGCFVASISHPCFHSCDIQKFCETYENDAGRYIIKTGIKVTSYATPYQKKTEGIIGQPKPQLYFHRSIETIFNCFFKAGFLLDKIIEPTFPKPDNQKAGLKWTDMSDIPPVLLFRMKNVFFEKEI